MRASLGCEVLRGLVRVEGDRAASLEGTAGVISTEEEKGRKSHRDAHLHRPIFSELPNNPTGHPEPALQTSVWDPAPPGHGPPTLFLHPPKLLHVTQLRAPATSQARV